MIYFYLFVCVYMCVMFVQVPVCRIQEKASDPLELELQEAVSHFTWVMETELRSPGRAESVLNS